MTIARVFITGLVASGVGTVNGDGVILAVTVLVTLVVMMAVIVVVAEIAVAEIAVVEASETEVVVSNHLRFTKNINSESTEMTDIEEIAQQAHSGADVSEHFTGHFQAKQQINIALPLELLRNIDAECQLQKIDRQDWIKMVCTEKIREIQASRMSNAV